MLKTHIVYKLGSREQNKVMVDGHDLTGITESATVHIDAEALPEITIRLFVLECEVDAEGIVYLDSSPIPEDLAREFYETLKKRFEEKTSHGG